MHLKTSGRILANSAVIALSVQVLIGCSLTNPHVEWTPIDPADYQVDPAELRSHLSALRSEEIISDEEYNSRSKALTVIEFRRKERVSYARALQYADDARRAYRDALGDQAELQNWLGIGLIPLSAAAVGLGATGVSPEAVLALGLTGAAGYGLGTWLINRPRQRAYVAGFNAMTCAVEATQPLGFTLSDQVAFEGDLALLRTYLREAEEQIGRVEISAEALRRSAGSGDSQVLFAEQQLASARALAGTAGQALENGNKLKIEIVNAGRNLRSAVDKIGGEVQRLIVETQLDLSTLFTIMNGLGESYGKFTAVPDSLRPAAEGGENLQPQSALDEETRTEDPNRQQLKEDLLALLTAVAKLADAKRRVSDVVNAVDADTPRAALASCGVDESTVISDLTVDPAGPFQIAQGTAGSVSFRIHGGQSPFNASLAGSRPDGLTIEQRPGPFSRQVVISTSDSVPAGSYAVTVTDGSGERSTSVTVEVVASDGAGAGAGGFGAGGTAGLATAAANLPGTLVSLNGAVFSVATAAPSDDGGRLIVELDYGGGTPTAEIAEGDLMAAVAAIDPDNVAADQIEIVDAATLIAGLPGAVPPDPLFVTLSEEGRKRLQAALCLEDGDVDGVWGPKTKAAFLRFQEAEGIDPVSDGLTTDLMTQILGQSQGEIAARCQAG